MIQISVENLLRIGKNLAMDYFIKILMKCSSSILQINLTLENHLIKSQRKKKEDSFTHFINLLAEHGDLVRWKSVIANHRPKHLKDYLIHPYILPGFSDAGAHNRNMSFHDATLQLLKLGLKSPGWCPMERLVSRVTGEPGVWMGMTDVGILDVGKIADVIIVNPDKLVEDGVLGDEIESYDPETDGELRLVRSSEGVVELVVIGGKIAMENGEFVKEFGKQRFGRAIRRIQN